MLLIEKVFYLVNCKGNEGGSRKEGYGPTKDGSESLLLVEKQRDGLSVSVLAFEEI